MKKKIKNNYEKTKKKAHTFYKRVKEEHLIKEYFKNNVLFLTFVLTCLVSSTMLRFFTMHTIENYLSIKPILADLSILIITGAFGYLFKPKNRFVYYMVLEIFFTFICMVTQFIIHFIPLLLLPLCYLLHSLLHQWEMLSLKMYCN